MSDLEESKYETPTTSDSEFDENEFDQTFVNCNKNLQSTPQEDNNRTPIQVRLQPIRMAPVQPVAPPPEVPIVENPLENFFKAEPTAEEQDELRQVPVIPRPTEEERTVLDATKYVNQLKRDRTNIYSSITRMTNSINNVMAGRDLDDWKTLEVRAKEANINLWYITQELNKTPFPITDAENQKAAKYGNTIQSSIAKIKAHIQALETGIDACIETTTQALEPEDGGADDEDGAVGGAAPHDRELMNTLIKLVNNMSKNKPPVSDYRSLKPVEIPIFSGDTTKYHYFKEAFKAAHDWRKLDKKMLALQLQTYLKGPALKLAQDRLKDKITNDSYDMIWRELEHRYGGSYNEDASITEQFDKLPVLKTLNCKELEKTYDMFQIQQEYYNRVDRLALDNPKSVLNKLAKAKLTVELGGKYVQWCTEKGLPQNFRSMTEWLKVKYEVSLIANREYSHLSDEKFGDRGKARYHYTNPDLEQNSKEDEFSGHRQDEKHEQTNSEDEESEHTDSDVVYWAQSKSGGQMTRVDRRPNFQKKFVHFNERPQQQQRFGNKQTREPLKLKPTDSCVLCKTFHEMSKCPKFKDLSLSEKKLIIRSSVLCYHCLSTKHFVKDCKVNEGKLCGVRDCKLYHHPLIHTDRNQMNFEFESSNFDPLSESEKESIAYLFPEQQTNYHVAQKGAISLQTVVCNVAVKGDNIKTVALLDTGSTMTAIDEDFVFKNDLKILAKRPGQEVYLIDRLVKLEGFQYKVQLTISSVDNNTTTRIEAWTVKNLVHDCGIVDWSERKKDFPHLRKVNFPQLPKNPKITILFGCNTTRLFAASKVIFNEKKMDDPVAMRTFLGWTCLGKSSDPKQLETDPTSQLVNVLLPPRNEN